MEIQASRGRDAAQPGVSIIRAAPQFLHLAQLSQLARERAILGLWTDVNPNQINGPLLQIVCSEDQASFLSI